MNPENVKQDFSMNEAIRRICMNSCTWAAVHLHHDQDQDRLQHSLRNTNVEKVQQMFTTTERRNADLQPKESAGLSERRSWEESLLSIMHITAQRYLQTIYSQGVCLYRSCAVVAGKFEIILNLQEYWNKKESVHLPRDAPRDPDDENGAPDSVTGFRRTSYMYLNVERHRLDKEGSRDNLRSKFNRGV